MKAIVLKGKGFFVKNCHLHTLSQQISIARAFELVLVSDKNEQDLRPEPLAAGLLIAFSSFPLSGKQKTVPGIK